MTYPEHIRQEAATKMNDQAGQFSYRAQDIGFSDATRALCQCIEELHAAKAEIAELVAGVREARERMKGYPGYYTDQIDALLAKYPEPKPDPLEVLYDEIMKAGGFAHSGYQSDAERNRAIDTLRRGLEIREARHDR